MSQSRLPVRRYLTHAHRFALLGSTLLAYPVVEASAASPLLAEKKHSSPSVQHSDPKHATSAIGNTRPRDETLTVVAQRRRQNPQTVPVSLSVIGGDQILRDAQLQRTSDIAKLVPNLQGAATEGPERPRWFMRGIGTNSTNANTVNPVGVYYDEVYIANVYNQGFPLFDLAQTEVLRGPQGTLWGKNANGGAINLISQAPTFKRQGYAKFGYGSFNHSQEQVAIGGTIIPEKVAGRFAFYGDNSDGWQKNVTDGKKLGGGLDTAARGQLLIRATPDLNITLNGHYRRFDGSVYPQQYAADLSKSGFGNPSTVYIPGYNTPSAVPKLAYDEVNTYRAQQFVQETGGFVKAVWSQPHFTLTSISAAEGNRRNQSEAYPMIALPTGQAPYNASYNTGDYWQATQEIRIASHGTRRWTWQAGLFGMLEHLDSIGANAYYHTPVTANGQALSFSVPPYSRDHYDQNWQNGSAFASATYNVTSRLHITGGLRWSIERIGITNAYDAVPLTGSAGVYGNSLASLPAGASRVLTQKEHNTYRNWNSDFTIQYDITRQAMAYFRFASGKMPGNYSFTGYSRVPGTSFSAQQLTSVNPETIDSFELGAKTQFWDHRLTLNADVFRYNYANALVNVPTNIGRGITTIVFRNAGAARIQGAEVEAVLRPVVGLKLGANLGLLDTRYTSQSEYGDGILGAQIPRSPHVSLSGYADYDIRLPHGDLILGSDFQYYSKQYFYPSVSSQTSDPLLSQRKYALWNAHLTWFPQNNHHLSFDASVLNLQNSHYKSLAITPINGLSSLTLGQPRSFFLQAMYRF